ncbi:MAG: tRNA (N6-threonylcarbamoyladenosine(37)-N6)-methyltransferase TrmO [Lachnospiraceae bacterium]|nr:tRNA (N6-threonylcarbamoyladenosine(37)-N6)-methyltransferase TrmO [Lachnospiraceae bacterium]
MWNKIEPIAYIRTDFPEKFGIPRQSGLIEELKGKIVFEKEYRSREGFRGLDEFDYVWLLWGFSMNHERPFNATVKPPRLGGNKRMGVFATRSPYHPNNIGLSCVKLEKIEMDEKDGPVLYVAGVDLMDETPIYDIKPYLPYADSHPDARSGFAGEVGGAKLKVIFPKELLDNYPKEKQRAAVALLEQDPRPAYQKDPDRQYGVSFAGYDIHFKVREEVLTVVELVSLP